MVPKGVQESNSPMEGGGSVPADETTGVAATTELTVNEPQPSEEQGETGQCPDHPFTIQVYRACRRPSSCPLR